ncbi:MAG: type III toxin-antitoxin system ToxN/AbiQ family toxin [Clostridiales bacterium]|nr:type III toxin-antitoxin system ToxN/AbiQ family toxin [Clostridiales bacterium]
MTKKDLILIRVEPKYIDYLRQFDSNVQLNSEHLHKENKPFVGIIFKINFLDYFIPISSNKKVKLIKIYNNYLLNNTKPIDMFFIEEIINNKRRLLSVLNINNMVPIPEIAKIYFNINEDKDTSLLRKEILFCNNHKQDIFKNSLRVYNSVINHTWTSLERRCCNFKLLEEKSILYQKSFK